MNQLCLKRPSSRERPSTPRHTTGGASTRSSTESCFSLFFIALQGYHCFLVLPVQINRAAVLTAFYFCVFVTVCLLLILEEVSYCNSHSINLATLLHRMIIFLYRRNFITAGYVQNDYNAFHN